MDRVKVIFNSARQLVGQERAAYLDQACGDDNAFRAQVERMLENDSGIGSVTHADEPDPDATIGLSESNTPKGVEQEGDQIDRYKLLQPIGDGGFGVVWMAEQREPVKRRVALKVLKLGMDSKQVIARFEVERQALAMMDHPNIAKVFDAGVTNTGRPYFVMELVKGVPIIEYCDREKLDTRARLDLFMKVCHAIQHAHQKGVIHRDIKPDNVLVTMHDGIPVPKVIDFGIAKATNQDLTDKTLFTLHHQMIGTPAYMSPEQAEMSGLDIDTRSDIYALGVLLYELLTGTTPFAHNELMQRGFAEMLRIIREETPHKPSTRLSSLGETGTRTAELRHTDLKKLGLVIRGDLDWIVMKCLEKDRTRRYDNANGLADDIQRHLSNEPVTAGPPTASYRFRKFVRRNRGQVLAGGVVLVTLIVGLVGTSIGMLWAINEKNRADEAVESERQIAIVAKTQQQIAEENLRIAEARLHQIRKLIDVYGEYEQSIRRIEGATAARSSLVSSSLAVLKEIRKDQFQPDWLSSEIASAYLSIGEIEILRDDSVDTVGVAFEEARDIYRSLSDANPLVQDYTIGLIRANLGLARHHGVQGSFESGEKLLSQTRTLLIRLDEQADRAKYGASVELVHAGYNLLSQEFAEAIQTASTVLSQIRMEELRGERLTDIVDIRGEAIELLGRAYRLNGEPDRSREFYEQVIDLYEAELASTPADAVRRRGLCRLYIRFGQLIADDLSNPPGAIEAYRKGLVHAVRLVEADQDDGSAQSLVLELRGSIVAAYRRAGETELALADAEEVVELASRYAAADPTNVLKQRRLASKIFDLARVIDRRAFELFAVEKMTEQGLELKLDALARYNESQDGYRLLVGVEAEGSPVQFKSEFADILLQSAKSQEQLARWRSSDSDLSAAEQRYIESVDQYEQVADAGGLSQSQIDSMARAVRILGTFALNRGEGGRAVEYLERADSIKELLDWNTFARKAAAYQLNGQTDKAIAYVQHALDALDGMDEEETWKAPRRQMIEQIIGNQDD